MLNRAGDTQAERGNSPLAFKLNAIAFEVAEILNGKGELAYCYMYRGLIFAQQSRYPAALEDYQRALPLFREAKNKLGEAATLGNMGNAYESMDNYGEALTRYQASLKIARDINDRETEANLLGNIGNVYKATGKYADALEAYQTALRMNQKLGMRKEEATTLGNIGSIYRSMGEYTEALKALETSLEIAKEVDFKAEEVRALNKIGEVCLSTSKYTEAKKAFEASLKTAEEIGYKQGEADALNNMGIAYDAMGNYVEALKAYKASLRIFQDLGVRQGEAATLSNIGSIYRLMGNYTEALKAHEAALKIAQSIRNMATEASVLGGIGNFYKLTGRYAEALEALEASLRIVRDIGDKEMEAAALNDIGSVLNWMGKYAESLGMFKASLKIAQDMRNKRLEAVAIGNIGEVYWFTGRDAEALEKFEAKLKIAQDIQDKGMEMGTLSSIGNVYLSISKYLEALRAYQAALKVFQESGVKAEQAWILSNMGVAYRRMGKYVEALEMYEAALKISEPIDDKCSSFLSYWGIGNTHRAQKKWHQALPAYRRAVTLIEQIRQASGTESLKTSFLEQYTPVFDGLVQCDLALVQNDIAFTDAESSRARALIDLLAERKVDVRQGAPPELLQRERELMGLTAAQAKRRLELESSKDPNPETFKALEAQLLDNERQLQAVQIQLRGTHYATLQYPQPLTVAEAQKLLPPDTALLAYYVMEDETALWVVTAAKIRVYRLKVTARQLEADITAFRAPMDRMRVKGAKLKVDVVKEKPKAHSLYQQLVAPARADLQGIKRLVIVPHRSLFYLPFAALEVSRINDNPRYLIEDYAIVVVPSATVLRDIRHSKSQPPNPKSQTGTVLAFAPFAKTEGEKKQQLVKASLSPTRRPANVRAGTEAPPLQTPANFLRSYYRDAGMELDPLDSSGAEVKSISSLFRPEGKPYVGEAATEAKAKAESGGYRFLHFATHAILDDRNPQYSGIALAEANPKSQIPNPKSEDGFLQTQEIFNLTLNADLVVLSACETAFGKEKQSAKETNAEGFSGLTRGFLYAGTPTVVVSLWKVNDQSTAELMKEFYKQLAGWRVSGLVNGQRRRPTNSQTHQLDKAEALRQAQLKMLRNKHPFYWAAFVVVGDWQ